MNDYAKASPKDVFMHLLAVVALYISAVSFGALTFQFINRWLPDPLTDHGYYRTAMADAIRWFVAMLTIVFPVYVWTAWSIQKEATAHASKRNLKIRKWLLYLTLFLAAAVIIGDLIALIYNFLGGELSARFLLKVGVVLFIAASVFGYYLWNLKSDIMASRDPYMRWFVWAVVAIVVAAVVYGFVAAGSPFAERMRRFDERRVQDLQNIQWQAVNYWQKKEKLPNQLYDLRDEISGFVPPRDPESGNAYEYRVLADLKFELCATFATESSDEPASEPKPAGLGYDGSYMKPTNWMHSAGRVCFERTIDPALYPPVYKTAPPRG